MTVVLRVDSVGRSFGGSRVLTSAYFQATAGSVTALLGRNGAGKSTLLKIAAGLLAPDHGFVEFLGIRHPRPRASRLAAQGVVYLPVDYPLLAPDLSIGQHFDVVVRRYGAGDRGSVLRRLGVDHLEHVPARALSGGERRRAEVALALFRRPVCLLLDEPLRGVDPRDAEVLCSVIRESATQGVAVVLTGHESHAVLGIADRVVWVREGTTEELGSAADAADHWKFRRDYLGARR